MKRKWRDICTDLVFIWPLFSALLPCCWKKWMESWRDKKKWAWWLRNRSGGKEGRHWMPAWRWDTRFTTVRKWFIRKGGYWLYWMLFLFPSENARGDGRGFRGVASFTPAFILWPWAWSSGEVLPKGTKRNKDHTGHSQGMWHIFALSLVWSHVPTCSTFSILLSPWRWFSQHLHSCPCQTCSVLWRGWVSRTKTSWGFCSAVLLNWEEGRNHRDIQFWS